MNRNRLSLVNSSFFSIPEELLPTLEEIKEFTELEWWEDDEDNIFVDWDNAQKIGLEFLLIEDSEPVGDLVLIDTPLKRYNETDGFYHA